MDIKPSLEEFKKIARLYNTIPVWTEILSDLETPVSAFLKIYSETDTCFLLESVEQGEKIGRYSFIGFNPFVLFKSKSYSLEIETQGKKEKKNFTGEPLKELENIIKQYHQPEIKELPGFIGGAVGYISYDYVKFLEKIPTNPDKKDSFPDVCFQICGDFIIFDHVKKNIIVLSNAFINSSSIDEIYEKTCKQIYNIIEKLNQSIKFKAKKKAFSSEDFVSNFKKEEYEKTVKKAQKYIRNGDIIQVVPSQRWEKKLDIEPLQIYRALRSVNPSPYMFFLSFEETQLIGSSPEILVKLDKNKATLRPIAGTRPRGKDEQEDKNLEEELKKDKKEIAEHVMLVDLGRNDLGRVCKNGSVSLTDMMFIERYSHVMHIVSNVTGILLPDKNQFDLLRVTFPAGTVTGAPKVRAMEIIEELEPTKRGPYAGAVGYFGFQGNMDFCITIRTFFTDGKKLFLQAGGGIVADSIPENEYKETVNKSMALRKAYELSKKIK
jgi:anthranilate synthase component 1